MTQTIPTENDEIRLLETPDKYTTLTEGDEGIVTGTNKLPAALSAGDQQETKIHVDWHNSPSSLALLAGEDEYEIID